MKTYEINAGWSNTEGRLVVGTTEEIRSIIKALNRAERRDKTTLSPYFLDDPILVPGRIYGLEISEGYWLVHNASTVIRYLELI